MLVTIPSTFCFVNCILLLVSVLAMHTLQPGYPFIYNACIETVICYFNNVISPR